MADQNKVDFSKVPGLNVEGPQTQNTTVIRAPRSGETSLLTRVTDALPKNLASGLFGERQTGTGRREGGVVGFFAADSFRNAFSQERIYENRRNRLLEEGYSPEVASDFAYRVVSGQSLEGLDDDVKKQLKRDGIVDKGFAALDTPVGIGFKGVGLAAGTIGKSPAGAIVKKFFGNFDRGAKVANKGNTTTSKPTPKSLDFKTQDPGGQRAIDEVNRMFDTKPDKVKVAKEKTSKFYDKMRTEWTDRFTPIKNLTSKIESRIGSKIDFKVDPYVAARLYQGVNGQIQNTLDTMGGFIKKAGNFNSAGQRQLAQYLTQARMAERAARGIKNPANITLDEATAAKNALETPEIKSAADGIKTITDDLLDKSYKGGIISKEAFESIKANNQSYVPFDVLEKMDEGFDSANRAAGGFSVADQNVVKSLQGTDKDIANPLEALTRKIINTTRLIERNEVAKKVAAMSEMEGVEDVKRFDKKNPLEEGNEVFHTYQDGQKVSYQAPKDVVEAMKGMNRQEVDMVTGIVGKTTEIFKGGVTTFNIAFQIPNMVIDFQDAMVIAKNRINLADWARGFSSAVGKGDLYKQWREDGGAFSTYVSQARSARMSVDDVTAGVARKTVKTIGNPLRLLEWMGSVAEETNRLAVYSRALRNGEDRMFAAYDSRQASVDFARSGNKMRVANQWIPFINARLQGSLNLARVSKERPARTALRLGFLAAGPAVATYMYNREFPEYYDIPQWEKDANFIIMTGTWQNSQGETRPSYVKIPKGHIGRMVANPMENFMEFQDSADSTPWDELALQSLSNVLPADVARDGELSSVAFLNSVLPPAAKAPIEVQLANKSFFTERNIVPRDREEASSENQFRDDTTDLAKDIGKTELAKKLGLSPAGFDHYVSGLLGQVGRDFVNVVDTARGKGIWLDEDLEQDKKTSKIPIVSRFIGYRGGANDDKAWEQVTELRTQAADRRVSEEETAREILETIRVASPEALPEIMKEFEQQGMLTEGVERRIKNSLKQTAQNITSLDRQIKALPVTERANHVISVIRETEADDLPRILKTYEEKGILTDAVEKEIRRQLAQ